MGVNSLPKSVSRQRRGCDFNPGPSAPESSTLTTRLPSPLRAPEIRPWIQPLAVSTAATCDVVSIQLVDILSSLLERPTIGRDFEPNYATMMRLLDAQLNHVKRLYDDQMALYVDSGAMPIHRNMAPVSGSLKWAHELRDRITIPMNEFRRLDHPYARGVARSFSPVRLLVAYKSRRNATLQYTHTHTPV